MGNRQSFLAHMSWCTDGEVLAHQKGAATKDLEDVSDNWSLGERLDGAVQQPALIVRRLVPIIIPFLPLSNYHPPDQTISTLSHDSSEFQNPPS